MKITQQKFDRSDIRQLNTISVLNQLRRKGLLSRAQIAAELGLTRATVSKIALDLLDAAFLVETHFTEGGAGRPGMLLNLNAKYGCIVAVEIDLDRVSIAVADFSQKIFWREEKLLDTSVSAVESLKYIEGLIDEALAVGSEKMLSCLGIGVAWAGLVAHEEGRLVYGPSSGWKDIGLKGFWGDRFGVPVYVENEANAAAIGSHYTENSAQNSDLIYVSLGAGLAAGVISEGRLLRGHTGFAGQVGHVPFLDNGVTCSCGRKGCWVTEIGARAVLRKLANAGVDIPAKPEQEGDPLDMVLSQTNGGEPAVREVLSEVGQRFARGAAQLVQTFNPSSLVLGGRLGPMMKLVETEIQESLRILALPGMMEDFDFRVSDSGEDPLIGCLAIVHDAILNDPSCRPANIPEPEPVTESVTQ
jgi:predicted NBD/HSP70 family sugar kinase